MPLDPQFWTQLFRDILVTFVTWLPKLLVALFLLLVGWLVARLSQFFLAGLLRRLGLDRFAERAGLAHILANMGFHGSVANLLARIVYWLILLVFLLVAAEGLGLSGVTETINSLITYLPRVLAAALVLLLGSFLARIVGEAVTTLATQSGIASGPIWGQVVRYILLVFASILALEQLGVATTLLTTVTIALIAATALALALAFGLGNRELARNIMAGFHAKETFAPGQKLLVRGHSGRLVTIGPVKSVLETSGGHLYLPNIALIDEDVIVAAEEEEGDMTSAENDIGKHLQSRDEPALEDDHIVVADYVASRLPPAAQRRATAHLSVCSHCHAAVAAAQQITSQQHTRQNSGAMVNFIAYLVQGGITLIAPALGQIPRATPPPGEAGPTPPPFEPLRVLQPRVVSGLRRLVGRFAIVLALTIGVLLLPRPAGLTPEGQRALGVFVFTGSILALEPVSLPIAALMVPLAQVALRVAEAPVAFETYSRPVVFLILASLFLAEALRKHGITRRLALATIVTSGGGIRQLLLGLMAISALLSMWVENTATAAVLIPVALTISRQVPDPKKARPLLMMLVLGIAYSASIGGMATIMGSSSNAVASGFLAQIRPWSFVDWMVYGLPAFLLVFPATWWILSRLVPLEVKRLDVEPARQEYAKLGSMSSTEREILLTMAVAAFFWVSGSFLEPVLGLPKTLLSAAMVAVMAVAYLAIRQIIDWEDVKGVSWGIFLTIGAGLSLGEALSRTGVTDWFAGLISPLVSGPPLIVSLLLLVYLSAFLTNVMNNTTIAAVFVPILISLAQADPSFNAVQLVMPVTLATTFGYSLPSASSRMALIAATGIVSRGEMMRYGLIITLVSSGILALLFYVLSILNLL